MIISKPSKSLPDPAVLITYPSDLIRTGQNWSELSGSDQILTRTDQIPTRTDQILTRTGQIPSRSEQIPTHFYLMDVQKL